MCPICNQPVPENEATTYGGRHENCAVNASWPPKPIGPFKLIDSHTPKHIREAKIRRNRDE